MYSWQAKEEEEEEEDGEVGFGSGKNLTIFLVEATTVMGEMPKEGNPRLGEKDFRRIDKFK